MITREQLEHALSDENFNPTSKKFLSDTKGDDNTFEVIKLLRERVPMNVCTSIIGGAEHDTLYLCLVDDVIAFLSEEDLRFLSDRRVWIDEDYDSLAIFA